MARTQKGRRQSQQWRVAFKIWLLLLECGVMGNMQSKSQVVAGATLHFGFDDGVIRL